MKWFIKLGLNRNSPFLSSLFSIHSYSLLCLDNYIFGRKQWCSSLSCNALLYSLCTCIGISCQNNFDRPWHHSSFGCANWTPTEIWQAQHVFTMSNIQTSTESSLPHLQSLHFKNGSSLSMDEQLHWCRKHETLFAILNIYLVVLYHVLDVNGVELFLLCQWRLYLQCGAGTTCKNHDNIKHWIIPIHIKHAHECLLWAL